jgi:AcrR family transcriptional regulator
MPTKTLPSLVQRSRALRRVESSPASSSTAPCAPVLETDEPLPPPPRQKRSIEKRARIEAAARAVFADFGYEGASIEEITSRASTAVGAFYLYFPSKRQLLVHLVNQLLQTMQNLQLSLDVSDDVRASLHDFLAAAMTADRDNYGVIKAWQEASAADEELRQMRRDVERWTNSRVQSVLELLHQHRRARAGVDVAGFARLVDRHLRSLLARVPELSRKAFDQEVRVTSDMIYHYLIRD